MHRSIRYTFYLTIAILALGILSCASPRTPQGGPKDTTPPQLDSLESTPNLQTNFVKKRIELHFDEWVQLEDVFSQVVISPPLRYPPEIKVRGKMVYVEFDEKEELKEKTTYTINFGQAIRDLNESNPVSGMRFVFSTGPVIDSLQVKGTVHDAFSGDAVEGALVMLYETLSDTVILRSRPYYFARTDDGGRYSIQNIRSDTFRVFALLDENLNYQLDLEEEKIDAWPEDIILTDSFATPINFRIYQPTPELRLINTEQSKNLGKLMLEFNRPQYDDFEYTVSQKGQTIYPEPLKDSLLIWHKASDTVTWTFYSENDTLTIRSSDRVPKKGPAILTYSSKIKPGDPFTVEFNRPLSAFDTTLIRLTRDSINYPVGDYISIRDSISRTLEIAYPFMADSTYAITLDSGAVTGFFGAFNDSSVLNFKIFSPKDLGNLDYRLDGLIDSLYYVVQLLDKKGRLMQEDRLSGKTEWARVYRQLQPANYTIRIILDSNNNGRWDPGIWRERIPAERLIEEVAPNLRANWDVEFRMNIEDKL